MKTVNKYIWKYFVKYQISFVSIRQIIKYKICVRKINHDFEWFRDKIFKERMLKKKCTYSILKVT